MVKRGDTLVEVTLAIGIFSMVAVAVVALVNSSTSSAQTALEITLAREEIDVQAEALRFIQSSYATTISQTTPDTGYQTLWEAIIANAIEPDSEFISYNPATCAELYKKETLQSEKAFVINPAKLGVNNGSTASGRVNVNEIVLSATDDNIVKKFHTASTYPRLIYSEPSEGMTLVGETSNDIDRVEGIYVVAVKGGNTTIVNGDGSISSNASAFYDFYIRTCWYGIGAERPSTISTVIRLYKPAT